MPDFATQMAAGQSAVAQLTALQSSVGSADWSRWTQSRWSFYDYVQLNPLGDTQLQFFNVPVGGTDPNIAGFTKTYEDTNLQEVRSFGRINFLVKQIRVHIRILAKNRQVAGIAALASAVSNDYTALANYLVQFSQLGVLLITLGQKEYWDIPQPLITCPAGFGLDLIRQGANTAAVSPAESAWLQSASNAESIYTVQPEQLIEAGQTFNAKIQYDNANYPALTNLMTGGTLTPKVQIGLIFDGFLLRPVQ